MVVNQKVSGTASSVPGGLAVGGLISLGVTLGGSVLCAMMVSREIIGESAIGYCALGILLASSFLGASAAVWKIKHRRLMVCGLSGLIYYSILLSMTALFFGGQYQGMGVTAMAVLVGCTLVVLLGMRQGRRDNRRRYKKMHR